MHTSIPAYLREGMAAGDPACRCFWSLWLQACVLATTALFAVIFTILADHVLPPIEGLRPSVLLIDTAICLPAVILGLACAMWPAQALLPRLDLGPFATAMVAPLAGTAMLCLTATGFIMLWTGSMLDELVSHPGLTILAMVLAGFPAMMLAQMMIWPWGSRAAPIGADAAVS
mgnify:CR=1 FL=1|jgi:hypothetical protein